MTIDDRLRVAVSAARAAGAIALGGFGQLEAGDIEHKGAVDLLTRIDAESEKVIRAQLGDSFPMDGILGEEDGRTGPPDARYVWVVDPLDGTTNYVHGSMHFAVSIGLVDAHAAEGLGEPIAGVIHAPCYQQTWVGSELGAVRHDHGSEAVVAVKVSGCTELASALIATGFPYDRGQHAQALLEPVQRLLERARGVRRMGAASLDFASVAQGVFDGFFEYRLAPWDMAAGVAIVRAAGGVVTDGRGGPFRLDCECVVASAPGVHASLLADVVMAHAARDADGADGA